MIHEFFGSDLSNSFVASQSENIRTILDGGVCLSAFISRICYWLSLRLSFACYIFVMAGEFYQKRGRDYFDGLHGFADVHAFSRYHEEKCWRRSIA